jgi:hypothetical protein
MKHESSAPLAPVSEKFTGLSFRYSLFNDHTKTQRANVETRRMTENEHRRLHKAVVLPQRIASGGDARVDDDDIDRPRHP